MAGIVFRAGIGALFGGTLLLITPPGLAAEPPTIPAPATSPSNAATPADVVLELPPQWTAIPERPTSSIGAPVDVARLDTLRGGESTPVSLIVVDGTVEGNSADRIHSGNNTISGGAFDNANGINTVIQNTGTNVLIQNAMVVTVQFTDPAP